MNCQQVSRQMLDYLEQEKDSLEADILQEHLANCRDCQQELEALSAIHTGLRRTLVSRAAQAVPSDQAWNRLEARLRSMDSPSNRFRTGLRAFLSRELLPAQALNPVRRAALVTLAVLVMLAGTVVFVPAVRAQVSGLLSSWFTFSDPDGKSSGGIEGFAAFRPYSPTYLPRGFQLAEMGAYETPESTSLTLLYSNKDGYIRLVQEKGPMSGSLPPGRNTLVRGQPAVFADSPASSYGENRSPGENYRLLVWYQEEIRMELHADLEIVEMLRIAESLAPMAVELLPDPVGTPGR